MEITLKNNKGKIVGTITFIYIEPSVMNNTLSVILPNSFLNREVLDKLDITYTEQSQNNIFAALQFKNIIKIKSIFNKQTEK